MKIKFFGATESVTGSCHLLNIDEYNILLDCGLYQGSDGKENRNSQLGFNAEDIDLVILSHAHMDHSGRIPLLFKEGFKGRVICTKGTADLSNIMLIDCAHIQVTDANWKSKKREEKGLEPIVPLYDIKDAEESLKHFEGYDYDEEISILPNIKLTFRDAGHLLGSAICEILINEMEETERRVVYSGDIGNVNLPILKDPTPVSQGDIVIMETTYGNKEHKAVEENLHQLVEIVKETFEQGGNVIIPSFSVGRTQEIIYGLNKYVEQGELTHCKVYVDSPLAKDTTKVFEKYEEYFDCEAKSLINMGDNPLKFKGLYFTESTEESVALKDIKEGVVIIAASGMCEGGRVVHHLKNNLEREECTVVFVGYQSEGTLGKKILNGESKVKIFGEEIQVKAKIYNLEGLSGHGDKKVLHNWLKGFKNKPNTVFLVHGEGDSINSFNREITSKGYKSIIPKKNQEFTI